MKPEDAIEIIDDIREYLVSGNPIWDEEPIAAACDMAIEALSKQITKQVQYTEDHTWGTVGKYPICPECGSDISKIVFFPLEWKEAKKMSYCEFCGQAISWEEETW